MAKDQGGHGSEKRGSGERAIHPTVLRHKLMNGHWEMEYEPDRNGRFTVMKGPRKSRETMRLSDEATPHQPRTTIKSTTQNKKY